MAPLLTLVEYKNLAGIPVSDTTHDTQLNAMLSAASLAIRNYTDRSFETATVTEQRMFEYDGAGYLDIDDATAITEVALSFTLGGDQVLDSTYQWRAMPYGKPVYYYIALTQLGWGLGNGEMGFMYNLDRAVREGLVIAQLPIAKITATWGWPAVPEDVKLATMWTMEDWGAGEAGSTTPGVTSESIEGFSRSFGGGRMTEVQLMGVPNRAKDILAQYQRVYA